MLRCHLHVRVVLLTSMLSALIILPGIPGRSAAAVPRQSEEVVNWDAVPGYTVVLSSELREDRALQIMRQARAEGINAGVLWSSGFSSLRPGYWVVYAGRFSDARKAAAAQAQLRARGYKTAYARYVRR